MGTQTLTVVYASRRAWLASVVGVEIDERLRRIGEMFGERAADGLGGVAADVVLREMEREGLEPDSSCSTCWRTRFRSAPSFTSTCAATPSPPRIKPNRMCSVPM
jgi:hypothetical protein